MTRDGERDGVGSWNCLLGPKLHFTFQFRNSGFEHGVTRISKFQRSKNAVAVGDCLDNLLLIICALRLDQFVFRRQRINTNDRNVEQAAHSSF